MAINYNTYVSQIANLTLTAPTSNLPNSALADTNFAVMLPGMIDYAEQRMYRELDLLNMRVVDETGTVSSGNRVFSLPTSVGTFLVVEELSAISAATGRNPLTYVSKQWLDAAYPSSTTANGTPRFWTMLSDTVALVGPSPDIAYNMETIGTQRPAPLTTANSSTFLTRVLPDAFVACSMVFASAYMRDFGQTADTPQMGTSWESQYQALMKSASGEEMRKKYVAPAPGQAIAPPPKG